MKEFTIYQSDHVGSGSNTLYPRRKTVSSAEELREASAFDFVCAAYENNRRSVETFMRADCVPMDMDNDHSDDPARWITPEQVLRTFEGVTVGIQFSRHHMKQKGSQSARPRFHALFACNPIFDRNEYALLKRRLHAAMPQFDKNALDAARFLYGTPGGECLFRAGEKTIDEWLCENGGKVTDGAENMPRADEREINPFFPHGKTAAETPLPFPREEKGETAEGIIPEGCRNSTLSRYAAQVLKRYGLTDESRKRFVERAGCCRPPLEKEELKSIWKSAVGFYRRLVTQEGYVLPADFVPGEPLPILPGFGETAPGWEPPLPICDEERPAFPVEALPWVLQEYVTAVAESTQTSPDMAAVAALTVVSAAMRNLYKVRGRPEWTEPTNLYSLIVAEPSERKSAVLKAVIRPVDEFVRRYNKEHSLQIRLSEAQKTRLENHRRALLSDGHKISRQEADELHDVLEEMANYRQERPMRVYVDDTTPERLVQLLAENDNAISLISSEGGIFDVISGVYSSKSNIDVFLKGYSGERIDVSRISRENVGVDEACLTILLTVQPVVIDGLMKNEQFHSRGLTARFLYSVPASRVGARVYETPAIPEKVYRAYSDLISGILTEKREEQPRIMVLSEGAQERAKRFFGWIEQRLTDEYSAYGDWIGKLMGNTLRIAGILARCGRPEWHVVPVIEEDVMESAEKIALYFFSHAVSAYSAMGVHAGQKRLSRVLDRLRERNMTTITRRELMRECRWLSGAEEAQMYLDTLEDYGYIKLVSLDASDKLRAGRPKNAVYAVNPLPPRS